MTDQKEQDKVEHKTAGKSEQLTAKQINEKIMEDVPIYKLLKRAGKENAYFKFAQSTMTYADQSEYFSVLHELLYEVEKHGEQDREKEIVEFALHDTKFFCGTLVDDCTAAVKHLDVLLPQVNEEIGKKQLKCLKAFCLIKDGEPCSHRRFKNCQEAIVYVCEVLFTLYPQFHEILLDIVLYVTSCMQLMLPREDA